MKHPLDSMPGSLTLLCTLALLSCGTSVLPDERARVLDPTDPELGTLASGLHGKLPDTTTKLYKVTDPLLRSFHLLVSNKRGYRLQCKNSDGTTDDVGVNRLISAAGFNPSNPSSIPEATYDSPELRQDLGISQFDPFPDNSFGALPCNFASTDGALLAIDVDNTREFFLDMNEVDASSRKYIIRTVSCGELLSAMGLDLRRALLVDLPVAQLHWTLDDKYNINCARGTPPAQFIPTLALVSGGLDQMVSRGSEIGPLQFRVDHLGANEVVKSLEPLTNECFDQGSLAISSLLVTGRVSGKAPNKTCRTSFVAKVLTGKDSSGNDLFFTTAPLTLTVDLGCEVNSLSNCGACGTACAAKPNQAVSCQPQTTGSAPFACTPGSCATDFDNCDGNAANGCEANLWSSASCGSCTKSCSQNADCLLTSTGRDCKCRSGFEGDGKTCTDKCQIGNGGCDPNATCANTINGIVCACKGGYSWDGTVCKDKCTINHGGCDTNAICTNTGDSIACTCRGGYSWDGMACKDKCTINHGGCDTNAICTNTGDSIACTCRGGYLWDGTVCKDKCTIGNGGCDQICTNTGDSIACTCRGSYDADGKTCKDKCLTNNGGCHPNATCTNTGTAISCACKAGYSGNGVTCDDINECSSYNGSCPWLYDCINTPGSYECRRNIQRCLDWCDGEFESCKASGELLRTCAAEKRQCRSGCYY